MFKKGLILINRTIEDNSDNMLRIIYITQLIGEIEKFLDIILIKPITVDETDVDNTNNICDMFYIHKILGIQNKSPDII